MLVDSVERKETESLQWELEKRKNLIIEGRNKVLKGLVVGRKLEKEVTLKKKTYKVGTRIDEKFFESFLNFIVSKPDNFFTDRKLIEQITEIVNRARAQIQMLGKIYEEKKKSLYRRGDLPPGVITLVKIYVAQKRKIKVGDKMAGRHGGTRGSSP